MESGNLKSLLADRGMRLADLASALNLPIYNISRWAAGRVPPGRVLDVERVTGISRHELRPDVFGPLPEPVTEAAE